MERGRRLLGQILKHQKVVDEGMIQEALTIQRERGGRLGEILSSLGYVTRMDLARALAEQAGMGFCDLAQTPPSQDALAKIDAASARAFGVVPVALTNGVLSVALADPQNASVLSDLAFSTGLEVRALVADEQQITGALDRHYREDAAAAKVKLKELVAELKREGGKLDLEDKQAMASAAPVVKLLNYVLYQAIRDQASDIHLEPFEAQFKVR